VKVLSLIFPRVRAAPAGEYDAEKRQVKEEDLTLPSEYIALLLTVDWFLDRCRTMINVMGDVSVARLLDGRTRGAVNTAAKSL